MDVVRLEAFHIRQPLRRAVRHASASRTHSDNIIVRCVLADGSIGWGEGVPRDYVTGETIELSWKMLQATNWAAQFRECQSFAEAVQVAQELHIDPIRDDPRHCLGNAARCAVELAWIDAYGHAFGEPLMNVTQLLTPELYWPREAVHYSGIVASQSVWKVRWASFAQRLYGLKQLKVKVGVDGADDVARLQAARYWAGSAVDLRLDANEAWPADHVVERVQELQPYGISCVEQPVKHEDVQALAEIRQIVPTPIMLDESLCSLSDAEQAIQHRWADAWNLRLSKCGGFIPSLRLAQRAKSAGLFCQLGCQVGESGILSAAGRHFATSVRDLRYVEGSYDRRLVRYRLTTEDLTFGFQGRGPMLVGSGLGVSIDPEQVYAITVNQEVLIGNP